MCSATSSGLASRLAPWRGAPRTWAESRVSAPTEASGAIAANERSRHRAAREADARLTARALRGLPLPRLRQRSRGGDDGAGGRPSPARRDRERDPRPQVRRRAEPSPLGPLRRQRRLARGAGDRAQPRPLDGAPRARRGDRDDQDAQAGRSAGPGLASGQPRSRDYGRYRSRPDARSQRRPGSEARASMPAHASRTLATAPSAPSAPSAPPSGAERRLLAPARPRRRRANAATPAELSASPAARPVKLRSVDSGLGPDSNLRRWAERYAGAGAGSAKNRAVVAVARWLSLLLLGAARSTNRRATRPQRQRRPHHAERRRR